MNDILPTMQSVLTTTPERWQKLTEAMPADLLRQQPKPGEWSAVECLQHLVDVEQLFVSRLHAFLEGKDIPAFDPDTQGTRPDKDQPPSDLAARFADLRTESLKILEDVADSDLERTTNHAELGAVTLAQMMHEWAAHDLSHTVQAEEALMQPFIRGCGPWQRFFAADVIS